MTKAPTAPATMTSRSSTPITAHFQSNAPHFLSVSSPSSSPTSSSSIDNWNVPRNWYGGHFYNIRCDKEWNLRLHYGWMYRQLYNSGMRPNTFEWSLLETVFVSGFSGSEQAPSPSQSLSLASFSTSSTKHRQRICRLINSISNWIRCVIGVRSTCRSSKFQRDNFSVSFYSLVNIYSKLYLKIWTNTSKHYLLFREYHPARPLGHMYA